MIEIKKCIYCGECCLYYRQLILLCHWVVTVSLTAYKKRLAFYSKNNYDITYYEEDGSKHKYIKKTRNKGKKKKTQSLNLDECLI